MPAPVYSLRIFSGLVSVASGPVGPVVPAGLIYVVRDIDSCGVTGAVSDLLTVLNPTGGFLWIARLLSGTSSDNWQWRGRQVYAEGEQVVIQSLRGDWDVCISGYQLTLP